MVDVLTTNEHAGQICISCCS